VAASLTVAEYLAPTWITRFRQVHPGLRVSLAVSNSEDVLGQVLAGQVPVGFVETPTLPRTISSTAVAFDELVVVVAPHHPWARRRRPLRPADLAGVELVLRETGSGTRLTLIRALNRAGVTLADAHLDLASTAAVKAAAAAGDAPAVLSDLAVASELANGSLVSVPVAGLDLTRSLRAVWPAGVRPTGPASDLVRLASGRRGDT
jgi:DNA-binding transcriptional LysR family regulator